MKKLLLILLIPMMSGCTLIPTDFMPRPVFVFSQEAIQYRAGKRARNHAYDLERETNEITAPVEVK